MPRPAGELLLVTHRDPVLWHGGGPTYVRAWARAVVESGLEPHIVTLGDRRETTTSPYGVIHRVPSPIGRYSSQTLAVNAPVLGRAALQIVGNRPGNHVVHGFSGWPWLSTRSLRRLRAKGSHVTHLQTAWTTQRHEQEAKFHSHTTRGRFRRQALAERAWNQAINSSVQRRVMRSCDLILVNYAATAAILTEEWGPGLPLRVVPYLPESAFTDATDPVNALPGLPVGDRRDAPLIMTMSRHVARKGLDVLLQALAMVRDRGVDFTACLPSTGRLLDAHRNLANHLGLTQQVTFPGLVDEPRSYIRAGDVFVLPSLEEGSGSVSVLEALQAGVPVVASDVDGIGEDLSDGVNGMLVPPGDARSLAARLEQLLTDPQLRERLGAAGRNTFEERFSSEVVVPQIGHLYRELGLAPRG